MFDPAVRQAAIAAGRPLRIAIDIGTTTPVVCLVDAISDTVVAVRTEANAQKSWGSDVVARIQAVCHKAGALAAMQKTIVRQLDRLIHEQLRAYARRSDEVGLVAVAGNTVMLHLLAGADPTGVARLPFRPAFLECRQISRVHLAGGFGTFMRPASALDIGLLPESLRGKIEAAGNTALKGALLANSTAQAIDECARIASRIESVDLAADPGFQAAFAECMLFPEELVADGEPPAVAAPPTDRRTAHVAS